MPSIIEFFDYPFFTLVGGVNVVVSLAVLVCIAYLAVTGIIPVWWRLGIALSRNKIAIFADSDHFSDLKKVLIDSKLFKEKNIVHIGTTNIQSAKSADLLLVYWPTFKDKLDNVLMAKSHSVSLVVYAPQEEGRIDEESMNKLNKHHNVIITNFRGRLLNDVFVSMITTKREK